MWRNNMIRNIIIPVILITPALALAGESSNTGINWGFVIMNLLGGLALFLYGMEKMSEGMKKSAGDKMRSILSALTNNRVIAMIVGAFVTMVIQSSSATTVMLVSFVQAELMSFTQTLGVILGADIGTTITAQLIAFKLTNYAILMIAVGFGITMFARKESHKHVGEAILGFGILFFGMKQMSAAMVDLRDYAPLKDALKGMENPLLGLLVGTLFTALIQSSSAFTGIVITLSLQGFLTLEAGIPLIFGANIGTCITAGLASIGTTREAKRVALAHVLFKIGGVALFFLWIPTFASFIENVSMGADVPRQIANAHTILNVSMALVFLPFTALFAKLVYRFFPEKEEEAGLKPATWHLDESSLSTPALAIDLAKSEVSRMTKILGRMVNAIIHPFLSDESGQDEIHPQLSIVEGIEMREEKIDYLDEKVLDYLVKIGRKEITDRQASEVYGLISVANDIESIADIVQKNFIPLIAKKRALNQDFSKEGQQELEAYHVKVCKQISRVANALDELDPIKAKKVLVKEEKYEELESQYRMRHLERLYEEKEESQETHEIHVELMDLLKQINVYTGNIAKAILKTVGGVK